MSKIALSIYLQPSTCCIGFVNEKGQCLGSESHKGITTIPALIALCEQLQGTFRVVSFHCIGLVSDGVIISDQFVEELSAHFQAPVNLVRPGLALASYEYKWGHIIAENNFVTITIHSNIDGGLVLNGKLALGDQGLAGNLAHLLVHENGQTYTLSSYFSPDGIRNMALKVMTNEVIDSPLRNVPTNRLTMNNIMEAAASQDKLALEIIQQLGAILGLKLSDIVNYFSPKYFVISTFSKLFSGLLIQAAALKMEESIFPVFKGKVKVITSKSQENHSLALQAGAVAF